MNSSKAAEESALLKAIVQESATEVLVFDAKTHRIIQANPSAIKNLQHKLKDLKKLTPLDCLIPEDGRAFNTLLSLLKNGRKHRTTLNAHCRRRDGTHYPIEARLYYSGDQEQSVFIYIANDVSQREATKQALEHTVSDLRAIVAHIPGMAYQVLRKQDGSTSLCYVSEKSTQLLGLKAAALRADPGRFFNLIMEEDKADYLARLAESVGGHMSFNWEGRIWMEAWKDVKWVNIRVSQRETPEGQVWDGILLNVTHSKLAEAEIRRSHEHLSALAAHVAWVKEQERLNLAREVHDDLGGNLTAIKIGLSWLMRHLPADNADLIKRTTYLDNVVDQTIEATHRIATSLRPPVLDFGIVSALEWKLQRFSRDTDIAHEFISSDESIPLSSDAAITVFRIVQEALTNVAKHARASRVKVSLSLEQGNLLVTVTDNGQGIQPAQRKNEEHGFGVLGMVERATALGGTLTVQPAKRRGTQVSLRIPLTAAAADTKK